MVETAEIMPAEAPAEPLTTIVEYTATAAALADLERRIGKTVYDVSTAKLLEAAKKDRAEVRGYRVALEKMRVEIKAPALERCRQIDSEAKRITAVLERLEAIPHAAITAEEARKEAEKQARIAAEVKRVADLQERVAELRGCQMLTPSDGSECIQQHIDDLQAILVDESFQEFQQLAASTKSAGVERLTTLLGLARAHEAEQERLRLEREELALQRAAQAEAHRKERERIAAEEAEAKRIREQREAETLAAIRAHEQAAAAKRHRQAEEQAAKLRAEREAAQAEHARIAAENARLEAERLERQRIEDDARAAEAKRIADEQLRIHEEQRRQQQQIDAQRAELERQQQLIAAAQAPSTPAPVEEPAETSEVESLAAPVAAKEFAPTADHIANLVATEFGTSFEQAMIWCLNAFEEPVAQREIEIAAEYSKCRGPDFQENGDEVTA